ncbi:MAG TPA: lipopolysaccharide heptosyltransferase II [Bryobacteraceae bacterium]|jgi:heptosyltransferase-2
MTVVNPSAISRVCVRATNWLGDAVMSLPAIRSIRVVFSHAHLAVIAKASVADLYARESSIDRVIPYTGGRQEFAGRLRRQHFDAAILLQNAFDAALMAWLAGIPERIGYNRDGRGLLLTRAIAVPETGEIPRNERYYYLELLRRAGFIESFPKPEPIRLDGIENARRAGAERLGKLGVEGPAIGVSPGAAYGGAKRWLPDRFAESAAALRGDSGTVLVFGSAGERDLCRAVAARLEQLGAPARNLAGETTLAEFIDLAAACRLFLTNDSGAMHVASALAVPTVAVFGATDDTTTGPAGPFARVVREHAECAPCLLRECPIDHRCMTRVTVERVTGEATRLLESASVWTPGAKS